MDIPRDPTDALRERWRRRARSAVLVLLLLLLFAGLTAAVVTVTGPDDRVLAADLPPPEPADVWADRIAGWAEEAAPLNSLIVARRDTILVEWYGRGMGPHRDVNVKSVSKTIMSALIGIALRRGDLDSLGQRAETFLPAYFGPDTHPQKRALTLEDLITMTTGLEGTSFRNYDPWVASRDWVRYALEQPVVAPRGERMDYSTGNTHLLSAILTEASGLSTLQYARRYLLGPLGGDLPPWDRGPEGYYLGGNNMGLSPRELLAFGQLYLDRGTYRGERILDASWVERSWLVVTHSAYTGAGYGYGWWTRSMDGVEVHYALGYGGQYVFVIPALETVVVATSELGSGRRRRRSAYGIVSRGVVPMVRDIIRSRDAVLQSVRAARIRAVP